MCLAGMFATTFTATVLSVSIRTVAGDLHSSVDLIAWSVTGAMLAQAVAMPILGRVGDIRGHRRTFLVGSVLAVVFSVATAVAWDPLSLIAFRAAAQVAGAATIPASFAMLFHAFPPQERVRPSAMASGVLSGASVTGLAVGGLVIDSIGWRPLFLIQAALALGALVAAARILPHDSGDRGITLDRAGAVVLAAATFALTFGVNRAASWGFRPIVIGLLVAVPLLLWLLMLVERRTRTPVIPTELLVERDIRAAGASSFLFGAAHLGNFLVTPLLLEGVFGLSVALTSVVTMARTLSIALAAPSASRLGGVMSARTLAAVAGAGYAIALVLLALGTRLDLLGVVIAGLIVSGLAFGHAQPPLLVITGNAAPADSFGLASSLQQTSLQIGAVIGMSLLSAIVGDAVHAGPFVVAYLVAAVLAAAGGAAVLAARRHPGLPPEPR
ncbi:MFS transporter [Frankia canadensis]|uniref:MFS transporter n=1 Tax=Frankia canadensis TaxID=1836972 RepID=UPI001FAF2AE4|nr:MFS transporter [Frankia canadensis]